MTTQKLTIEEERRVLAGLLPIFLRGRAFEGPLPQSDEEVLAVTGADPAEAYAVKRRLEQMLPALHDLIVNHGAFDTSEGYDAFLQFALDGLMAELEPA